MYQKEGYDPIEKLQKLDVIKKLQEKVNEIEQDVNHLKLSVRL